MKIAAAIILYNPPENFFSNLLSYYHFVEKIFVFDNSDQKQSHINLFKNYGKIEYFHNQQNLGIAARLNQGCEKAIAANFDWLLTMDQDSGFLKTTFKEYVACVKNFDPKKQVALFGPAYSRNEEKNSSCRFESVDDIITSGMLLNLAAYKKIGDFDEKLFIDSVDHDYCIRAKLMKYELIKFLNINMVHELGIAVHRASFKSFYLIKKKKIIHTPLRCYYMVRNLLYLQEKYKNHSVHLIRYLKNHVPITVKNTVFYSRKAISVKKYIAKAKEDFLNNQMGKIIE